MSQQLLTPDNILDVIPGREVPACAAGTENRNNFQAFSHFRNYQFDKTEVRIPALRDYMMVRWKAGCPSLGFKDTREWIKNPVFPGDITLLTRAEDSIWFWMSDIEVSHIYLSHDILNKIAREAFDRDVDDLSIQHQPFIKDSALSMLMHVYEQECLDRRLGGELYLQTLEVQICVHLVRNYAQCSLKDVGLTSKLPEKKKAMLEEYIEEKLSSSMSIEKLAGVVGLSSSHFIRIFSSDYGVSPHHYVLSRRLARAKRLLSSSSDMPIKVIAYECGFSDQSHMTRAFKSKTSLTPKQYRELWCRRFFSVVAS